MRELYTTFIWETPNWPKYVVVFSTQIVSGWKVFDSLSAMMDHIRETTQDLSRFGELEYYPIFVPERYTDMDEYAFCQYRHLQSVRASKRMGYDFD